MLHYTPTTFKPSSMIKLCCRSTNSSWFAGSWRLTLTRDGVRHLIAGKCFLIVGTLSLIICSTSTLCCRYAVIAAGCAECPRLVCEREECGTAFCYHCAGVWHPVSTCDEARAQRFGLNLSAAAAVGAVTFRRVAGNALVSAAPSSLLGKIKPCPRCKALIAKMDDGSCNHMTCTICGADFCWLCMKEISDLHFLS